MMNAAMTATAMADPDTENAIMETTTPMLMEIRRNKSSPHGIKLKLNIRRSI